MKRSRGGYNSVRLTLTAASSAAMCGSPFSHSMASKLTALIDGTALMFYHNGGFPRLDIYDHREDESLRP